MGFFNYSFGTKDITEEKIRDFVTDKNVKRICFSRIQTHALWRTPEGEDMITVPFVESIGAMLKENTGIVLRKSRNGNYYKKLTGDEYIKAKAFVELYSNVVFLRDLLDVSVALSLNYEADGVTRTHVGELEKQAKYDNDDGAVVMLATIVDGFIRSSTLFSNAAYICAVPPTKASEINLPTRIIERLTQYKGNRILGGLAWTTKTESLKNAEGADKLEILKHSGLEIADGLNFGGKDVVLLDDLYMSGSTMQFVAMKLKEAGAGKIFGLCLVKSFSNN